MRYAFALFLSAIFTAPAAGTTLQCKSISQPGNATMGGVSEAIARISQADTAAGYRVTGGGCSYATGKDSHALPIWAMPVEGGFSCRARAAGGNDVLQIAAVATLCRTGLSDTSSPLGRAPFNNVGLGGGTIGIARAGKGPIPYGVRICNLFGAIPIEVDLTATQRNRLDYGQCIEIDRPQRVFFRTPLTTEIVARGRYELVQPGTFPAKPRIGRSTRIDAARHVKIVGDFKVATAQCRKPAPGEPFDSASYQAYCPLSDLGSNRNYRVCFDAGFSNQGNKLEYPGPLLPIVLDKALMAKPKPPDGQWDSYDYLGISAEGCRDLFGVGFAAILILNPPWNDQSVAAVTYRYAEIPPPVVGPPK